MVVAAVIRYGNTALLLERSPQDYLGGLFELPGGLVETGETLEQALRREVSEETGLALRRIDRYLGSFDYHSQSGRITRQFNFQATPQVTAQGVATVILSEHASFAWVGLAELAHYPASPEVQELLRQVLGGR